MGKNTIILGGGFGGLTVAHELRKGLGKEHRVVLVDKQPIFAMGLTKLWKINNTQPTTDIAGNRANLAKRGIEFLEGEVTGIDTKNSEARLGRQQLGYDYLVIALGADYSPVSTPGFTSYARNLYLDSGCADIRDALRHLRSGAVTVLVCGLPFKCPPAPYEATMIIDDVLRKSGVREKVKLQVVTPEPHPLTILGLEAGKNVVKLLEERGVEYNPAQKVVEIQRDAVRTESKQFEHDLVAAIPVHVAPAVIKESGLVDQSGWVPVNPETLATNVAKVYAIGDCAGTKIPKGLLLPRAGILAEEQGKVVAANIISEINGEGKSAKFTGEGVCFMEVGDGKAAPLRSDFYARPEPKWEFTPPSVAGFQEKHRFLAERMTAWFS